MTQASHSDASGRSGPAPKGAALPPPSAARNPAAGPPGADAPPAAAPREAQAAATAPRGRSMRADPGGGEGSKQEETQAEAALRDAEEMTNDSALPGLVSEDIGGAGAALNSML